MKKLASLLLTFALLFSFVTAVQAEAKPITVWLGEEQLNLGGKAPVVENGYALVPAELLLEELDFTVSWDEENKVYAGSKQGLDLQFQLDNPTALVNNSQLPLPVTPRLVDDVVYLPLRFVIEAAGYEIVWDGQQKTVTLQAKEASRGFLWKVENAGNEVYLLGSIHIANEAMYPLRSEIGDAYAESDYLVVEADISKMNSEENQKLVLEKSTYQDGTTLKDHTSEEAYAKLGEILKENGVEANALDLYKPWSVSSTVDYLSSVGKGYDTGIGIDAHFLAQANESSKPILELESLEYQLDMFDNFSAELQEEMLLSSIEGYYSEEIGLDKLSEMWITGDEEQLLQLIKDTATNEEMNKAMLLDRNAPMVEKIKGYLNEKEPKTYFVVVGALHMLGTDGLVPLLEKEGFTVTRQ